MSLGYDVHHMITSFTLLTFMGNKMDHRANKIAPWTAYLEQKVHKSETRVLRQTYIDKTT